MTAAKYRKISYPWGIVLNANGKRFVDEGEDLRNYTYAKFGREVIKQPKQFAWQIFDQKVRPMLYNEYDVKSATKVKANSLENKIQKLLMSLKLLELLLQELCNKILF